MLDSDWSNGQKYKDRRKDLKYYPVGDTLYDTNRTAFGENTKIESEGNLLITY